MTHLFLQPLPESSKKGDMSLKENKNDDGQNNEKANSGSNGTSEDESSYSSFYSSFLKTDEGPTSSNEGRGENNDDMVWTAAPKPPMKRSDPAWLGNTNITNELIYQYKVDSRTLNDVLNADLYALKNTPHVSLKFQILAQVAEI